MRKAREILRLKHEAGLSNRQIAASVQLTHVAVGAYLQRAREVGIGWPIPAEVDDDQLHGLLGGRGTPAGGAVRPLPEMAYLHTELRRPGVTLQLLWEEYRRDHPGGYGYTQFCGYYKAYRRGLDPVLRQGHKAGERMFVDWAGQTMWLVEGDGIRPAYLFVAVQGASNYTFAEAFEDTTLPSWIEAHIHAWEFFGGVATITVPDNDKSAVSRACRYEPDLNPTYRDLAEHYGTVIIPTRPGKPRDKAKVETAVQNAERRILALLRDQRFFCVAEANRAIGSTLTALNTRPFKKLPGSRAALFETLDAPALKPLPADRFECYESTTAGVNIDYHIQVDRHTYSVPYRLTNQRVEVRLRTRTIEIFFRGRRVAVHARSYEKGGVTTDPAHRPKAHQRHLEWTPTRLIHWAGTIGEHCARLVERILQSKPHPEQGYRACLGIMRLGRRYGADRLERACYRAVALDACSYRHVKSMLATGMDTQPLPCLAEPASTVTHDNLRGRDYYR